jgi:hypothetical protein
MAGKWLLIRRVWLPFALIVLLVQIAGTGLSSAVLPSVHSPLGARASARTDRGATLPPGRGLGGMAQDPSGNVLLFGGYSTRTSQPLGDTWIWDGTSWMQRHPADSPSARSNFGMAYDAARHQVVLFGGSDGYTTFDDTWIWGGVTWTQLHPVSTPPSTNLGEALAYDGARQEIVLTLIGGPRDQTWTWDGIDWSDASPASSPPNRWLPQLAYDFARKQVVQFGGAYDCFEDLCGYDDTWLWNGVNWRKVKGIQRPPRRYSQAMAYDPSSLAVVVFGGNGGVGSPGFKDDTWTSTGPDWTPADPSNHPLAREAAMMAWDRGQGVLVLFGGRDAPGGYYRDFQDTWTWDGTDWTCVSGCL